jgi:hypothetical protein
VHRAVVVPKRGSPCLLAGFMGGRFNSEGGQDKMKIHLELLFVSITVY